MNGLGDRPWNSCAYRQPVDGDDRKDLRPASTEKGLFSHIQLRAVNVPFLRGLGGRIQETLDQVTNRITQLAGGPFNVDSPRQLHWPEWLSPARGHLIRRL